MGYFQKIRKLFQIMHFLNEDLRLEFRSHMSFFFFFLGPHLQNMDVPNIGVKKNGAVVAGPHHSHSNAGSMPCLQPTPPQLTAMLDPLTHSARPGTEPTSSWILVRFISSVPQGELQNLYFIIAPNLITF